jgi:hypothetical protein
MWVPQWGSPNLFPLVRSPKWRSPSWGLQVFSPKEIPLGDSQVGSPMGFPKGGPQWFSPRGVPKVVSPWGSPIGVPPMGSPKGPPKGGSRRDSSQGGPRRGFFHGAPSRRVPQCDTANVVLKSGTQGGSGSGAPEVSPQFWSRNLSHTWVSHVGSTKCFTPMGFRPVEGSRSEFP